MAVDSCNPCNLSAAARSLETFKLTVLILLSRISTALLGGASPQNTSNFVQGSTDIMGDTAPHTVITVPAGEQYIITSLSGSNGDANIGTWTAIDFGNGYVKHFFSSAGGGGFAPPMPTGIPVSAGTSVTATNLTTGAAVYVSVEGYTQPA